MFFSIFYFVFGFIVTNSFAADSLSYSGRLVQTNGAPVAGPVDLKVELSYTNTPSTIICSQDFTNVVLSNGVFHLKLDLNCAGNGTLADVLTAVPTSESAAIRVTDTTHSKAYSFQAIHSMPFANISGLAKQLVQMGATDNQVLKWNDTLKKWEPGTPGGGGTVTGVSGTLPISVASGTSSAVVSITQANTTTNGYLSSADWNTFNSKQGAIAAGTSAQYYRGDKSWQTLDTGVVPENVANLYFTNARALGVPLTGFTVGAGAITNTDSVLDAFGKAQGQINAINTASSNYLIKNSTDSITGVVNVGTIGLLQLAYTPVGLNDATNKSYVDTTTGLKVSKSGDTMSGVLTLDSDLKIKGGVNYVTLKGNAASAAYNFILPVNAGTAGYVLSTDGSGNTSWINPSSVTAGTDTVTSASIVDGTIVNADISATAAIAQSKIANLTTDLSTINANIAALTTDNIAEATNLYFTNARVLGVPLTGLNTGAGGTIAATDSVLTAFGKLQYQVTDLNLKGQWEKTGSDIYYSAGDVQVDNHLKLKDSASNYVLLKAPATVTTTYTLTMPSAKASVNGQVLTSDTTGVLSWSTPSSSATPTGAAGGDLSGTYPNPTISGLDAAKISTGVVSNTEFNTLDGVTSSIQTQLDAKELAANLGTDVRAIPLTGYAVGTNTALSATDTVLGAFQKVQGQLNNKEGTVTAGTSSQYYRGDKTFQPLDTSVVPENTNLYFTNARAQGAVVVDAINDAVTSTAPSQNAVFDGLALKLDKTGGTLTVGTINGVPTPTNADDVVNKGYVDSFGQWTTSGGNVYRTSGNVGIGTTSPVDSLHISKTGVGVRNRLRLEVTGNQNDQDNLITFSDAGEAKHWSIGADDSSDVFRISNSESLEITTRILIDATGNVGIGTSTPQSKLDVNGAIRVGVDATACSATIAGAMRFNTPNVEYCNGTSWTVFGISGAAVSSSQITDGTIVDADVSATANIAATKLGTGAVDNTEFNYLDGVTSSIQTQLNGKQPLDATLTSLAAFNTNGILVQTAADTFVGRSIASTTNRTVVTNGDGVLGNPTINIDTALLPSPIAGDAGKFLKATGADATAWSVLASSDITTALGFIPVNKAGDSLTTGTIALSGTAALTVQNPVNVLDAVNKQYVDGFGQWTKSGSDIYRASGNVGIGTTGPTEHFHILDGFLRIDQVGTNASGIKLNGTTSTTVPYIRTYNPDNTTNKYVWWAARDGALFAVEGASVDGNSGTSYFTVSEAGNVGIGTTAPNSKLEVAGEVAAPSYKTKIFTAGGKSAGSCTLSSANTGNLPDQFCDLAVTFTLTNPAQVQITYSLAMVAGDGTANSHLVTGIDVDGTLVSTVINGDTHYWGNSETHFSSLAAGGHTIKVRYRTPGGGVSDPASTDWQNRILQVMIMGNQ